MSNIVGVSMEDPCMLSPEITVWAIAEMVAPDRDATRIYRNFTTLKVARDTLSVDIDLTPHVSICRWRALSLLWGTLSPVASDTAFHFMEQAVCDAEASQIGCQRHRADQQGGHEPCRVTIMTATPACCAA